MAYQYRLLIYIVILLDIWRNNEEYHVFVDSKWYIQ